MVRVGVVAFILFSLLLILGLTYFRSENKNPLQISPQKLTESLPKPIPTETPFVELTIPYLRNQNYQSMLGEIQEYSTNSTYESFLTSYTSDGLKINGLLTIPKGTKPQNGWPAIVFIHGYIPPKSYQTTVNYSAFVDFLARNNFVVFKIDLRGHGDSEGEAGGGYYSSDYVIDALNARAALQSSDLVNKDKIGFWGHSMAGNIVSRVLAAKPEIPAGVIWAGAGYTYLDLREYGISDNSYQPPTNDSERQRKRRELFEKHGTPSAQSKFWQDVAPTTYLKDLKGALQLHHAVDDNVVSIEYSRNLGKLLSQTAVQHELFEYPSGGHNLQGSTFNSAMQRTVEFFAKNLSP